MIDVVVDARAGSALSAALVACGGVRKSAPCRMRVWGAPLMRNAGITR